MTSSKVKKGIVGLAVVVLAIITMAFIGSGFSVSASAATHGASQQHTPGEFSVERDVAWRTVDDVVLTLDAYVPRGNARDRAAVVLVHGGAWQGGDKQELAPQGEALAAMGYVAISVSYRLAPTHPFPAAIEDVQAAVAWLRSPPQVQHYGIDPRRIGALGGSAGGHLAAMLGTLGRGPLDSDTRVAAVVTWSALTDLNTVPAPGFGTELYGCASSACPDIAAAASPITYVDASDAPMLLVNATDDPITHLDQATEMNSRLQHAGVDHELLVVPGTGHSTELAPAAWNETVKYLEDHLAPRHGSGRQPRR